MPVISRREALNIRIQKRQKSFYIKLGLVVSPLEPMTLMVTIDELHGAVQS